jgi:hypothetical protein
MWGAFGLDYMLLGTAFHSWETNLRTYAVQSGADSTASRIAGDNPIIKRIIEYIPQMVVSIKGHDLGSIEEKLKRLRDKLLGVHTSVPTPPVFTTRELIVEIDAMSRELIDQMSHRFFYFAAPSVAEYYGQTELFGQRVIKKFPKAASDIEHAGNCLALGESTAAVLHLVRAMDLVTRTLGKRLNVTITTRSTWGMILTSVDDAIKKMPDATVRQKNKKTRWAECRAQLYHVKLAWRDDSVHTNRMYNEKEARQILDRMREFLQVLVAL